MSSEESQGSSCAPNLFFAYARRNDNTAFSRYLLTFANANIAKEWWKIVQEEYKESERPAPQLFSFKGDNAPGQAWGNKKLEHLKTKWMYSQLGDANSSGGKGHDIIPLQDENGYLIGGGGGGGGVSSDALLEKLSSQFQEHMENSGWNSSQLRNMIKENTEQMKDLTEAQGAKGKNSGSGSSAQSDKTAEQIQELVKAQKAESERTRKMLEQNAEQIKGLTKALLDNAKQLKEARDQNASLIKALNDGQDQLASRFGSMLQLLASQDQKEAQSGLEGASKTKQSAPSTDGAPSWNGCSDHIIRPKPRKLDRKMVGYAYEKTTPEKTPSRTTMMNGSK